MSIASAVFRAAEGVVGHSGVSLCELSILMHPHLAEILDDEENPDGALKVVELHGMQIYTSSVVPPESLYVINKEDLARMRSEDARLKLRLKENGT